MKKDVIYIDIEDEITAIIDKLKNTKAKILAMVLPKRAVVLHSSVNVRLLKRAADEAGKKLVLITSEHSIIPLAGMAGIHVAKTLQSKPYLPDTPNAADEESQIIEEEGEVVPNEPAETVDENDTETIEIDTPEVAVTEEPKGKKSKKLKVPNFQSFRAKIILGVVAVVLLVGGYIFGFVIMPRATVTITSETAPINSKFDFTASVQQKEYVAEQKLLPAEIKEIKRTDVEKFAASGEKDMGEKAGGTVTLTLSDCADDEITIPAGTAITDGTLNYLLDTAVVLKSVKIGNQCKNDDFPDFTMANVTVTAENAGDKYNLSPREYSVKGYDSVVADGEAMAGGTSEIVKIITQQDIDSARAKLVAKKVDDLKSQLKTQLNENGYYAIEPTFLNSPSEPVVTPGAGTEAEQGQISIEFTVSMLGVSQETIDSLLASEQSKQLDTSKQKIYDNGLATATITVKERRSAAEALLSVDLTAKTGPQLDEEAIAKEIAGKRFSESIDTIKKRPGISEVNINYSPFWVFNTPKNIDKITIIFNESN